MFENIQVSDFFTYNTKRTEETNKILEKIVRPLLRNLKESENPHLSKEVMEIFIALLFGKELIYAKTKNNNIDENHCQKTCEKMIKALSAFYKEDKKNFSAENERALLDMFEFNSTDFKNELRKAQAEKHRLFKNIPGKTLEEKKNTLRQKGGKEITEALESLQEEWDNTEKSVNDIFRTQKAFRRMNILDLLFKTDFFDRFLEEENIAVINFLTDFFKENPSEFYAFLERGNRYISRKRFPYEKKLEGFAHILENSVFASAIREKIPAHIWSKKLVLALGCNALHRSTHLSSTEDFVRKLEEQPEDKLERNADSFFKMVNETFIAYSDDDSFAHSPQNLRAFLTTPKTKTLQQLSLRFFNNIKDDCFNQILDGVKEDELQSLCNILIQSPKSRKRLIKLKLQTGKNLVWTAFAKGALTKSNMELLISEAIAQDDMQFLFSPKEIEMTDKLPCYRQLCDYFKDKTQALHFIDTFQKGFKTEEQRFTQTIDFIQNKEMKLKISEFYRVVNFWAKENADKKILSFLFDGDIEKQQNLVLKISEKQARTLLLKQDKDGKTPWHYFCSNRNRLFFGKNFKILHQIFLQSCQIKDKDGKTPLDYISGDLKFRKILAEKIPATEKLMERAGMTLEYKPQIKEDRETTQTESLFQKAEAEKTKEKESFSWNIQEMGHDKLRRDPFFQALLKREINQLPPPNCGSVNVANNRLQKKEVLGAPVFKIWYENKRWRVPFVKDDNTQTLFIFPASDRNDTYTNQDYCRIVRNRVKWLKRQNERTKS